MAKSFNDGISKRPAAGNQQDELIQRNGNQRAMGSVQDIGVPIEGVEFPMREAITMVVGPLCVLFGVIPVIAIFLVPLTPRDDLHWWNTGIIYDIYPRSFQDSNADGIGDIRGIISRVDYLVNLGIDGVWIGPVFKSPMKDFGYDVSDYKEIDPVFGTMQDFQELVDLLHNRGLKVLLDFVPNHSSVEHAWFIKSKKREDPYTDYYVWHQGRVLDNGTRVPPNNWMASFGGPAWTWDEERREYYLHQFTKHQPDLNYRCAHVHREINGILEFWMHKGVDGFRMDAADALYETENLEQDEPRSYKDSAQLIDWEYMSHAFTRQQPETYQLVSSWKQLFSKYKENTGRHIFLTVEVWNQENSAGWTRYFEAGADMPSNMNMLGELTPNCVGVCVQGIVDKVLRRIPRDNWPNWVISSRDLGRVSSRKSAKYLQAMNMLSLTLPGLIYVYYGDEIGMQHITMSYENTKDPLGRNAGPERYQILSRDLSRAPMQWNSDQHAGFTSGKAEPWLPIHPSYLSNNVEKMQSDPNSLLSSMKELTKLREQEAMKWGFHRTATVSDEVYSFLRYTKGAIYPKYLVALNLGDYTTTVDFTQEPATVKPKIPVRGKIVFHTKNFPEASQIVKGAVVDLTNITLSSGQGFIAEV